MNELPEDNLNEMDKSKSELESLVQSQKKQLTRYETRLKGTSLARTIKKKTHTHDLLIHSID